MTPEERKLYEIEASLMELARKSIDPKIWDSMTPDEQKAYAKNIGFDIDYEMDVLGAGGATIAPYLDSKKVRIVSGDIQSRLGQYLPSSEHAESVNEALSVAPSSLVTPLEKDEVVLFPSKTQTNMGEPDGLSPVTSAHEFMHRRDFKTKSFGGVGEEAHVDIYARLGWIAQQAGNKRNWDDAVKTYGYFTGQTFADAQEELTLQIEKRKVKFATEEREASSLLGLPK